MELITKTVRLTGHADSSIEDAIATVLARAAATIDRIARFRVVEITGEVDESGVPTTYRVTLDITFEVHQGEERI